MEGTLEELKVIIDAEISPIKKELKEVQNAVKSTTDSVEKETKKSVKSVQTLGNSFKKLGRTILAALSITAIIAFGKNCIDLGSDLAEVQNVVDVTFGSMSEQIEDFSKTAITQFGLSELSAKQYSSTMGAMLKSMGLTGDAVYEMSTKLTGLAGDIASFYNLSGDEAFSKIRSGISGETEPLKQLGINMSVANLEAYALSQGITTAYSSMSQANQTLLRYNYLLSVTGDAQGDFARTSDSWANQTKILAENFNSIKASIGQGLINVFTPVVRVLNTVIRKLQFVADAFKNFTSSIFGTSEAGSTSMAADDIADMADSMSEAESSASAIKRSLAGFDKLNNISSGSSSNSSDSSTGITIDTSDITKSTDTVVDSVNSQIKDLVSNIKQYFKNTFKDVLKDTKTNLTNLKKNIQNVWSDISKLKTPLSNWFNTDFKDFFTTLVQTTSGNLNNILALFNHAFSDLWNIAVYPMLNKFITDGLPIITQFSTEMLKIIALANDEIANLATMFWDDRIAPAFENVATVFSDCIDILKDTWNTYGTPIFEGISEAIENTSQIIQDVWNNWLNPIWETAMDCIDKIWTEHLSPLVSNVVSFVAELVDAALAVYNNFVAPVVSYLVDILKPVFTNIFNNIYTFVSGIVSNIIDKFNGIITVLRGIVEFIKGVFTGDWKVAWEGVKKIFKGVWDAFVSIAKVPINLIIGIVNTMISGIEGCINAIINALNKLSFDVPDWVPVIGGETFGFNFAPVKWSRISYLAKGGIVSQATPAIIGEAGREAVLPLENNTGWMDTLGRYLSKYTNNSSLERAINKLADNIGDGNIYLTAEMDGEVLYQYIVKRNKQNCKMTGKSDFVY